MMKIRVSPIAVNDLKEIKSYIEKDYGSNEAQRGFRRQAGHYNPRRGLLG